MRTKFNQVITEENPKIQARTYSCDFLEAGLVRYEDETVLIRPENLMKIAAGFKGYAVIIDHEDLRSENAQHIVNGFISEVYQNPETKWAACDFLVDNKKAIDLIAAGYSVSCAHVPTKTGPGGVYHNIPYDREIIECRPLHLALVSSPRYEDAKIIKNSKEEKFMFKIFKNSKEEVKNLENAVCDVDGEEVGLKALVEVFKNSKKAKMNSDDEVEIDGEMVKVAELAKTYKASKAAKKNEAKDDEKKENEKEEDEKENEADEEDEKEQKNKKGAKKNSKEESEEGFEALKNAKQEYEKNQKELKNSNTPVFITQGERLKMGEKLYGSKN
jgi:hypothetical protein